MSKKSRFKDKHLQAIYEHGLTATYPIPVDFHKAAFGGSMRVAWMSGCEGLVITRYQKKSRAYAAYAAGKEVSRLDRLIQKKILNVMSTDKMTLRDQLEESPYKPGLVGIGFDNPLTSEGICQVLGRDPGIWSGRIVSAINNTYGAGINPKAVPDLISALKEMIDSYERQNDWVFFGLEDAIAAIEKARL